MQQESSTTIYVVRHGETQANADSIMQGHLQFELNAKGVGQALSLAEELKFIKFDAIFSSDLLRAKQTAEIIALEHKLVVNTSHLIRERMLGKYQGKPRSLHREENRVIYQKLKQLTDQERLSAQIADMETLESVVSRTLVFFREIGATYIGGNVLVVTHGGIIRSLLYHLGVGDLDRVFNASVENTGYIKILADGIDFEMTRMVGVHFDQQSEIG
jgi:phosphoserine phosphatase